MSNFFLRKWRHDDLVICDDCFTPYAPPKYYTFDVEDCGVPHEGCTGNICPECAGPYLTPDDPTDKRRPPFDE